MTEVKKCANPACTCVPEKDEKFCSPHCEAIATQTEIMCGCGHTHCGGEAAL